MRRWLMGLVATLVVAGSLGMPALHARAASANSWITIGSTRPGVGCSVDVSVEVRVDGAPVSGIAVELAFFDSGNNVLALDQETTDGDGVARLSFDTGGASAGESAWLDINIDGSYSGGTSIVPASDGGCGDAPRELTASPDVSVSSGASDDSGAPSYPTHKQERSLSCEYASLQIATTGLGNPIAEEDFLDVVPSAVNPHDGFRGDIDGPWGITDDYGVYAEPLADALAAFGFTGEVWYDPSASTLQGELDAGHPTLVWIATRGDTGFYDEDANGNRFKLVPYEHVVVAYAYDDAGVWVSDPGNGSIEQLSWSWFLSAWSVLDGMALSVSA